MVTMQYVVATQAGEFISHYHPPYACLGCPYCKTGVTLEPYPRSLNSDKLQGVLVLTGWSEMEDHVEDAPVG